MEATIIHRVHGVLEKNILEIKQADKGKRVLVLTHFDKGYTRIILDSKEGWIPTKCISIDECPPFMGKLNHKNAVEKLELAPERSCLLYFSEITSNYVLAIKFNKFHHIVIKRKEGGRDFYAFNDFFPSINVMLRGIANDDIYPLLFEEIDLEDEIICQAGLTTINKYIQSKNDEDALLLNRNVLDNLDKATIEAIFYDEQDSLLKIANGTVKNKRYDLWQRDERRELMALSIRDPFTDESWDYSIELIETSIDEDHMFLLYVILPSFLISLYARLFKCTHEEAERCIKKTPLRPEDDFPLRDCKKCGQFFLSKIEMETHKPCHKRK